MAGSLREETNFRYALCIGINSYASSAQQFPLRYAENDAQAMYEVLLQRGFAREHCRLLLGTAATAQAIQDALFELLLNKPKRNDLVLFYFAGHGVPIPCPDDDEDETISDVFLTSYDFDRQRLARERGAWLNYPLRFGRLKEGFFEKTRSKKVLFLLDSCHSGDFFGAKYREDASIQHFLDQSFAKMSEGRVVLSSCLPLQKAREEETFGHGLFTYHLLQALYGRAKDAVRPNGMMTVSSLFDYLAHIMPPTQRPVEGGVKHGSFELLYYPQWEAVDQNPTISSAHVGPIFDVPELPIRYVDRPEALANLRTTLQEQNIVGLVAALFGQGGIGKTYLATLLCHDAVVRERFPDGILWVTLGQEADELTVKAIQRHWLTLLGADVTSITTLYEGKEQLKQRLEGRSMLLVLDDVWHEALAQWVCCSSPTVRVLMTTRDISQIPDAYPYRLDVLPREQSCALLIQVSEGRVTAIEADEIAELVGDLPLGLSVLGGQMSDKHVTWKALKTEFQKNLLADFPDEFNRLIYASLQTSINALGDKKQRYLELAIFPNEIRLEPEVIIRYWSQTAGLSEFAAQRLLSVLAQKSLIQKDNILHDLPYAYLQYVTTLDERTTWHNALIATYGSADTWGDLPDDGHQYAWRHFAWHLAQANRHGDLRSLLLSASYLQHKIERMQSFSLDSDIALFPHDPDIILLGKTIKLSCDILDETPAELPNQITGRTGTTLFSLMHHWPAWPEPHLELRTATLQQAGADLLRIMSHQGYVHACAFSPDGRYALGTTWDTLWLWNVQTGKPIHPFLGHTNRVNACVFSPDGQYILGASDRKAYWRTDGIFVQFDDATLRLWSVQTGEPIHIFQGHTDCMNACAFSPDSRDVLSASDDGTMRLWDVQTRKSLHTFQGEQGQVFACTFSPDGCYALGASTEYTANNHAIQCRDVQTGEVLHTFQGFTGSVKEWTFLPAGERVKALSLDGQYILSQGYQEIGLWNVQTGRKVHSFKEQQDESKEWKNDSYHIFWGKSGEVTDYVFSLDGHYTLSASGNLFDTHYILRLWDVQTGKCVQVFQGHTGEINTCIFSPDGRYILSASGNPHIGRRCNDATPRLWDVQTGKCVHIFEGHTDEVKACAFSRDGNAVLTASKDGTLRLWSVPSGKCVHIFKGHTGDVLACAFSPNGQYVLSAANGGFLETEKTPLRLWDARTGECVHIFYGHPGNVYDCAFSPNGQYILSAGDTSLRLWDVQTEESIPDVQRHTERVNACTFSSDGRYALSASGAFKGNDHTLRLWNVQTGKPIHIFQGHSEPVYGCAFSPDDQYILSRSSDRSLRLWDTQTGKLVRTLQGYVYHPTACTFSPNGQYVLCSSLDKNLYMWDVSTGQCVQIFQGHTGQVTTCAFSPDGRFILSASSGGDGFGQADKDGHALRLWDVQTGKFLLLQGHTRVVTACVFSPNGQYILSASDDYTLRLWDVQTGELAQTWKHAGEVKECIFSPDGRYALSLSNSFPDIRYAVTFLYKRPELIFQTWDIQTGQSFHTFQGHTSDWAYGAFSPDGRYILSASPDSTLRLWNAQTGESVICWQGDSSFSCVAIDQSGRSIVAGDVSGSMHFFTLKNVLMMQKVPQPPIVHITIKP